MARKEIRAGPLPLQSNKELNTGGWKQKKELSSPKLGFIRFPGVPSITNKIAQEERVLETVLRKGASVSFYNDLTEFAGCPKHHKQESYRKGAGEVVLEILCWKRELL